MEAHLINAAKLIIWDEAPMLHKFAFEAVDRTFRDITCIDKPFGGKVFVFGGDFRQVLPVIPRSLRADVVSSSLTRSFLWKYLRIMKLTINMRLSQTYDPQENKKQKEFAQFLLNIGDGNYSTVAGTEDSIDLPLDLVMTEGDLPALINFVYPCLLENYRNVDYMVGKAILTPKNIDVEKVSELVLDQLPGEFTIYPSADSVDLSEDGNTDNPQLYSPEFLRSLKIQGLPPGELKLKVGAPIILLRNLAPSLGLCNGTRLICRAFQNKVIDAEVITGSHVGSRVFIPRMSLSPSDSNLPFNLNRRQFPIRVAFSMTINKSQGQTLSRVGLYLPQPVFSHGQLYVALSRTTSYQNIKVLIDNGCENSLKCRTRNVVYKEVFV
jgi:ATP-dependent DNA helicase PIF1